MRKSREIRSTTRKKRKDDDRRKRERRTLPKKTKEKKKGYPKLINIGKDRRGEELHQ
jgi:hypothetical protein